MPIIPSFCLTLQVSQNQPNKDSVCVFIAADSSACRQRRTVGSIKTRRPIRNYCSCQRLMRQEDNAAAVRAEPLLKHCLRDGKEGQTTHLGINKNGDEQVCVCVCVLELSTRKRKAVSLQDVHRWRRRKECKRNSFRL